MKAKKERLTFGLLAIFSAILLGFIFFKFPPTYVLSIMFISIPIVFFFFAFLFLFFLSFVGLIFKNEVTGILSAGFVAAILLFRFFHITHWFFFLLLILFFVLLAAFFYQKK